MAEVDFLAGVTAFLIELKRPVFCGVELGWVLEVEGVVFLVGVTVFFRELRKPDLGLAVFCEEAAFEGVVFLGGVTAFFNLLKTLVVDFWVVAVE